MKQSLIVTGLFLLLGMAISLTALPPAQGNDEDALELAAAQSEKSLSQEISKATPKNGQRIYMKECVSCHKADGSGGEKPTAASNLSPNLRKPEFWKEKTNTHLVFVIENGISKSGMVAMKGVLSREDVLDVTAYLRARYEPKNKSTAASQEKAKPEAATPTKGDEDNSE